MQVIEYKIKYCDSLSLLIFLFFFSCIYELHIFSDRSTKIGQVIDNYLKCSNDMEDHAIHLLFSANRYGS